AKTSELRELRRDIGFVFQLFGLVGRATCLENVLTGALGRLRGPRYGIWSYPKQMRREAFEHLDRVGLASQAYQRADTLSGGQMQRVAIARSLMQHPKIMLADEPVASLDPESSKRVMDSMTSLCQAHGMTLLVSLHQVHVAKQYCPRIIAMREGQVLLDANQDAFDEAFLSQLYRQQPEEAL
ncbi:MAG: ATP-binding cassette domain-containing protein, partial [Betaproteobacteria bacterium]|nr:ATP-binding cassette domain-containing protein [Betaproteobacteria bacterium]